MANEMDTLKLMEEIVQKEKLMKEVDWWTGESVRYNMRSLVFIQIDRLNLRRAARRESWPKAERNPGRICG